MVFTHRLPHKKSETDATPWNFLIEQKGMTKSSLCAESLSFLMQDSVLHSVLDPGLNPALDLVLYPVLDLVLNPVLDPALDPVMDPVLDPVPVSYTHLTLPTILRV